jgi:tRNA(fMet)-specific endonuclease VapC
MLDTNTVSHVIKGNPPEVRRRLATLPVNCILVSVVTQAELFYGLARKGHPPALARLVREFLLRVVVLPWDSDAAMTYGDLRASCAVTGITLGALDMMIASHAVAAKAILVTHDKAFRHIPGNILAVEDWTECA